MSGDLFSVFTQSALDHVTGTPKRSESAWNPEPWYFYGYGSIILVGTRGIFAGTRGIFVAARATLAGVGLFTEFEINGVGRVFPSVRGNHFADNRIEGRRPV